MRDLTPDCSGKLLIGAEGAVRRIRLHKPQRLNALDEEMLCRIAALFEQWEAEPEAAVVVLESSSARAFCVGADIARLATFDAAAMQRWERLGNRVLSRIEDSPLVSVASISGHALGGGLTLALACDFRVCSADAQFAQPEIDLGWIPGWGGVRRLARLAGLAAAKRLSMTGERFGADAARHIGLVDQVAGDGGLDSCTAEFVAGLAARSPGALRAIKALANEDIGPRFDALANAALLEDPRGQAAIARFLAKKTS